MSTFYTISEKISTPSAEIDIENLDASLDHWKNSKYIIKISDTLELLIHGKANFDLVEQALLKFLLDLNKANARIEQVRFYTDKENTKKIICLFVSDVTTFKPENLLKRSITFNFKKQDKIILFNDITTEEFKKLNENNSLLPATWQINEKLTSKFNKYKALFL